MLRQLAGTTIRYDDVNVYNGLITRGIKTDSGEPAATEDTFAVGCEIINIVSGITYRNAGTSETPSWQNQDEISTSEIADSAVSTPKLRGAAQSVTATADGLTTGLITTPTSYITMVAVTSAAGTNMVTLLPQRASRLPPLTTTKFCAYSAPLWGRG